MKYKHKHLKEALILLAVLFVLLLCAAFIINPSGGWLDILTSQMSILEIALILVIVTVVADILDRIESKKEREREEKEEAIRKSLEDENKN